MIGRCLSAICILFGLQMAIANAQQPTNKWTNPDGKEIIGEYVRMEGRTLVLLLENGKEAKIPLSSLSLESHLQALKLSKPEAFNKEVAKAPVLVEAVKLPFKLAPTSVLTSPFEADPKIDSFLKTVTDEFNRGNMFVVWHMMPPKMQTDMAAFLSKQLQGLGPAAPGQLRKLFEQLASIASKKSDWILDPAVLGQPIPPEELGKAKAAWPYVVAFLEGMSDKTLWDSSNFTPENVPNFLASVLINVQYLSAADKERPQALAFTVVSESADRAEVKFTLNGQEMPVTNFQKVGKIWVVPDLMNQIRSFLDQNANAPANPMLSTGFSGAMAATLPVLGKLDQAKTKEEFKKTMDLVASQFRLPPGAAIPGGPGAGGGFPGFPGIPGLPGLSPPAPGGK